MLPRLIRKRKVASSGPSLAQSDASHEEDAKEQANPPSRSEAAAAEEEEGEGAREEAEQQKEDPGKKKLLPRVLEYTLRSSRGTCSGSRRVSRARHGERQMEEDAEPFFMTLKLLGMDALQSSQQQQQQHLVLCQNQNNLPATLNQCPIAMEAFDKATVDFLPDDACFIEGRADLCIALLPCGHHFHALSLLCNMALASMRCPICRYSVCVCVYACDQNVQTKALKP